MKRRRPTKKPNAASETEIEPKQLDRFAGSSESEPEEEEEHVDHLDADDEDNDKEEEDDNDDDEGVPETDEFIVTDETAHLLKEEEDDDVVSGGGMASAMARILGTTHTKGAATSVVLSKTKTPLQKLADQERQREKELKEKRRLNREKGLSALHIPLSVATTSLVVDKSQSVGKELEQERSLRRVATRGVVALFNAISQHQKQPDQTTTNNAPAGTKQSKQEIQKMTKHSFLDMIKTTAAQKVKKDSKQTRGGAKSSNQETNEKPNWNALHDDYMLDPKKKYDSGDESSSAAEEWSDEEQKEEKTKPTKRRKVPEGR